MAEGVWEDCNIEAHEVFWFAGFPSPLGAGDVDRVRILPRVCAEVTVGGVTLRFPWHEVFPLPSKYLRPPVAQRAVPDGDGWRWQDKPTTLTADASADILSRYTVPNA